MASGNTDMANGNGFANDDARYASLTTRVGGLENAMERLGSQLASFMAKVDERQRTPWGVLVSTAVAILAYVTTIGGLAYAPLWSAVGKQDAAQQALVVAIGKLSDNTTAAFAQMAKETVSQQELKWRTDRAAEDRSRLDDTIADIRQKQVPRDEINRISQDFQKQIDEIKQEVRERQRPPT